MRKKAAGELVHGRVDHIIVLPRQVLPPDNRHILVEHSVEVLHLRVGFDAILVERGDRQTL